MTPGTHRSAATQDAIDRLVKWVYENPGMQAKDYPGRKVFRMAEQDGRITYEDGWFISK